MNPRRIDTNLPPDDEQNEADFPEKIPQLSADLIALIDKLHPHRCIQPGQSEMMAHREAGKRALIDDLIEWVRYSNEKQEDGE